MFPGFDGGAEWGGPAVDPTTGVIYINSNEMAWTGGLIRSKAAASQGEKNLSESMRHLPRYRPGWLSANISFAD